MNKTIAVLPVLFVALLASVKPLESQNAPASTTPGESVKLTGSDLKSDDLILKAEAIYTGKITDMGVQDKGTPDAPYAGSTYRGAHVQLLQILRCGMYDQMAVTLTVDVTRHESIPKVGNSYIFFVTKDSAKPTSAYTVPFTALKLLDASEENVTEVKRLIALPQNQNQLSGSQLKLPDAVKCDAVFIGEITGVPPFGSLAMAGASTYVGKIKVSQVFDGSIDNPVSVLFWVRYNPHEVPPENGHTYIFFVSKTPGWNILNKILPATGDNIAQIKALLPPAAPSGDFFCGDDLKAEVALVQSDAIFTGEITGMGTEDHDNSFSYAYPGFHLKHVEIKVDRILRGTAGDTTSATLFVNFIPHQPIDQIKGPYVFYVKNNDPKDNDPFTVLKQLPATDANIAKTKQLIAPSEYVSNDSFSLEEAVSKSDAIFIGDITELGLGVGSNVKVFQVFRGSPARQTSITVNTVSAPQEGSSYIFLARKNSVEEAGPFSALKLLPASDDNIAQVNGNFNIVPSGINIVNNCNFIEMFFPNPGGQSPVLGNNIEVV